MRVTDGRRPSRRIPRYWRRLRWPFAIGAWLVVGLLLLPSFASAVGPGSSHLGVVREVSGTVSLVNFDGTAFCLDTDATGEQYCSIPYRSASDPLVVGEHVTGTVVRISSGDGSVEAFVVTDPAPDP